MAAGRRARLTVAVLTWNGERRLPRLLAEAARFADEILVGVDEASQDGSLEVARRLADRVFRFPHAGIAEPARLLPLEHATGDWILCLDDDEGVDRDLPALLPELLAERHHTHFYLPRKWLVSTAPHAYVRAHPWYPDWQLRLFVNDRRRVWHPGRVHTGYQVIGCGAYEARAAILHYEPLAITREERRAKLARYRALGSDGACEDFYLRAGEAPAAPLEAPPLAPAAGESRRARGELVPDGALDALPATPRWRAEIEVLSMTPQARPGDGVVAELLARNTGRLMWVPHGAGWPILNLSYRLHDGGGAVPGERERFPMPRVVEPGGVARFVVAFIAPAAPGDYVLHWDLVSEHEQWFADAGGRTAPAPLRVRAPAAAPAGHEASAAAGSGTAV